MILRTLLTLLLSGGTTPAADDDKDRMLFTFDKLAAAKQWQTVNDDVMGGRSDGRFKINEEQKMEFFGRLSLANNGGFASVRSSETKLGLEKGDSIVISVRGDGREYSLNLYTPRRRVAFSYRAFFKTKKDSWIEVELPVDKFVATSFGRVVHGQPLDPSEVNGLGILLGDKKPGPFKMEVEWIKVRRGSAVAAAMTVQRDLAYVEAGHERHKLDVYAPTVDEDCPIVFWIHGGGWQAGDKSSAEVKPQAFVDRGFVFVSTNYRLLPEATIRQMAGDVAKSIRWVHDHAKEHGGDPSRMFVMGHSAGAQLAALVCTDDRYLKAEKLSLSIVKGCVPVDGDTYDVPLQIATVKERIANIYRSKFGDEESQKDLSPVTHVTRDRYIPPFLILHVADHPETQGQSNRLVKALREAGISAQAYPAKGKNHVSLDNDLGKPRDEPTKALFEFVRQVIESDQKAQSDKEILQGTWEYVAATRNGKPYKTPIGVQITFDGDNVTRQIGTKTHKYKYRIDPDKKPKQISLVAMEDGKEEISTGIYSLNGDTLRWCFNLPGRPIPRALVSEEGDELTLCTLKRVKPKKE